MERKLEYYKIKEELTSINTDKLINLINNSNYKTKGWGENTIIEINQTKIFVKSIIITDLEYKNKYNTSNLYNLPLYYNYGIGSAGINCWRELMTHIKTTNYVLNEQCLNFPLLYHYRIIEEENKNLIEYDLEYWNSNKNIKEYIDSKNKSKYRLLLFIEYFPNNLHNWLLENENNINIFYKQSIKIIDFLNSNNIIHFDTHADNFIVDSNNTIYLTDFGLVLDKEFNLITDELKFYEINKYYDYGNVCTIIYWYLYDKLEFYINNSNVQIDKTSDNIEVILEKYDFIFDIYKIKKSQNLIFIIKIAKLFNKFINSLKNNNKKNDIFPNKEIETISRLITK
jgi:serine/threonine protein kinase